MLRDSPPLVWALALVLALPAVAGAPAGVASAGTAGDATTPTLDDGFRAADGTSAATADPTGTTTATANDSGTTATATTATPRPTTTATTATSRTTTTTTAPGTPASTTTPATTPTTTPAGDPVFVVTDLSAPERYRLGGSIAVTATVTNRGAVGGTEHVNYSFGGVTADSEAPTLEPGESTTVRFELTADELADAYGDVTLRTYVHGVRNESGSGVARRLRATPDVDFAVAGFDAPTDVSREEPFVVLATVGNPGDSTITRRVSYLFESTVVAERAVTVAPGERRQVAFEVAPDEVGAAVGGIENGTTYYHAVRTTGGDRKGGAVRVVRGPSADADALAVEGFDATDHVRPGETVRLNVTLRNVAASDFEGQLSYRLDGSVVATDRVRVPTGERRTVAFRVDYGTIERAAVPLSARETTHGVWVGDDAVRTRPVTVHAPVGTDAPATPTPAATFSPTPVGGEGSPAATDEPATGPDDGGSATGCSRGLVTRCGGTAVDETTLTVLGTAASVFGIVHQLARRD